MNGINAISVGQRLNAAANIKASVYELNYLFYRKQVEPHTAKPYQTDDSLQWFVNYTDTLLMSR